MVSQARLEHANKPDFAIPFLEMGHTSRGCKQERAEVERPEVRCVNCSEAGHRARDCTEKRKDKFACRNCGYVMFASRAENETPIS